jgi:hypothetical protein
MSCVLIVFLVPEVCFCQVFCTRYCSCLMRFILLLLLSGSLLQAAAPKKCISAISVRLRDRLCGLVVRVPGYRSQRAVFDSRSYQIFWEVVSLEWGPLSLVGTIEALLGRKSSGSGLEIREYCRRDPSRWQSGTLYPQKLSLASLTSGGRSVSSLEDSGHGVCYV